MCGLDNPESFTILHVAFENALKAEILPACAFIASGTAARVARIAGSGRDAAAAEAVSCLLICATLRRSSFDALAASGALRAAFDAFVDAGVSDQLLLDLINQLAGSLWRDVSEFIPADVLLHAGPDVDRDCRQAWARLLLQPANRDVLLRLKGLVYADPEGANGTRGCPAFLASAVFHRLADESVVGPVLARESKLVIASLP